MDSIYLSVEYLFLLTFYTLTGKDTAVLDSFVVPSELVLFWDNFKVLSTVISLLLLTGIIYSYIRLSQIRKEEKEGSIPTTDTLPTKTKEIEHVSDERWDRVMSYINSENQNDWRQAIIEADTMLDELVSQSGYPGETLGERMRGIQKNDFLTLDDAWEAHKVRNRIAHDGASFQLSKREARRVVGLYKNVFQEFYHL